MLCACVLVCLCVCRGAGVDDDMSLGSEDVGSIHMSEDVRPPSALESCHTQALAPRPPSLASVPNVAGWSFLLVLVFQQDIMRAMKALQTDDTVPQGTRDLINQISTKFLHTDDDAGSNMDMAYHSSSSPLGTDDGSIMGGIHSPTASDTSAGESRLSQNPKTMEALKQITVLLQVPHTD